MFKADVPRYGRQVKPEKVVWLSGHFEFANLAYLNQLYRLNLVLPAIENRWQHATRTSRRTTSIEFSPRARDFRFHASGEASIQLYFLSWGD
jgi:hypothetical protein